MKEEAPPTPPSATTPPNAVGKASSASPAAPTTSLADDGVPRTKKAGVGPVRTRAAPSKTFVCRGFGDCSMVFSRSEHLARHVRKHTGERPFACHCGKQFSRLDNLRQHAQTVHSDKLDLNERMMRELTSLHTALAATSHRNLPRLSPSQPTPGQQPSRSQPSTPIDAHPGSAGVVPSMAYDAWRRDDFRNESFLGQSFPTSQSFRAQQSFPVGSFPASHAHGAYPDHRFPASDVHPHPSGRPVGRFLASNVGHDGPFQRPDPRGDGYDRPGLEGFDPHERPVDDGGGNKPFTSGGSAGGGLPPISSLIPRAEQSQSLLPPAAGRPATAGGLASWRPSSGSGRPASSSGWLPPLADRPSLAHRPATAAAPLGIGSAASSRPGTSGGVGGYDRDRDVFAFEPPALAAPRLRAEDDDPARPRDEYGYRLPFGLRPGTAPAASFDRGGRGREWERERPRYGRDESHERYRHERDESSDERQSSSRDRSRERYAPLGRPARDDWRDERNGVAVSGLAASSSDEQSPDSTMELRRRGSGGLYPGDADRDPGLLSPGGGGYDSPFSWHPPGLAPRKRSYDFGPGDANDGTDSRPASRRLTLMELCSTGPARDDDAPAPELSSPDGKPTSERGWEPPHIVRPATVSGSGDGAGGLPGIASFGYGSRSGTIHERSTVSGRGGSLSPPPSPPPTAMAGRDDDGASLRRLELHDRRDASTRLSGREPADGFEHDKLRGHTGASLSNTTVRASTPAGHWRGEHDRLRGQVRTPISPPPTATGVRAGSAS